MEWNDLISRIRVLGRYPTDAEAASVTRVVLSLLGGHVAGAPRVELAQELPREAAGILTGQVPVTRALTAPEFVDAAGARLDGATPDTARWDVSCVLSTIADLAGEDLTHRILADLPRGYALLFGRAELAPA